jgi:uncharacterized Ntn-hydrolase superfamily protein
MLKVLRYSTPLFLFVLVASREWLFAAEPRQESPPMQRRNTLKYERPTRPRLAPDFGVTGTFSICAVDPESGVCGAAVASMYPAVGTVVPFARGGVGAFCTQHWLMKDAGPRALDLLEAGKLPEEVLTELLKDDAREGKRQLAIIDMHGRTATRNCYDADPDGWYWGSMSGRFYACQGNTLVGREVLEAMGKAYEQTKGSLADRLVAALVAGDCAGGDHRGRLAAGIRVSKPGQEAYWLELQTDNSEDAVIDLLKKYVELDSSAKGEWRGGEIPFEHPCADRPVPKAPPRP